MLERDEILAAVQARLEPLDHAVALWEGGSAAFDRVDEYSDIDLQAAVEDERVAEVFGELQDALEALSPIALRYDVPEPTWHGHSQRYFRLADASPWCVVDACVMKRSSDRRYQATARHGQARVLFDKVGWLAPRDDDPDAQAPVLADKARALVTRFEMFHGIPRKEVRRGRPVDAMAFYQGIVLRPLVELLRIEHDPARHDFGPRYVNEDFPPEVAARLARLYYPSGMAQLDEHIDEATAWFRETAARLLPAD